MTTCYALTDSIGGATNPAYPAVLGGRVGWTVTTNVQSGHGYNDTIPAQLAALVTAAPDVALIQAGTNDVYTPLATLQGIITAFFTDLRAGLPNATIYAIAPWMKGATSVSSRADIGAAIFAAATLVGGVYLDWTAWITGTGKSSAPAGDGNADVYVTTDGVHPTLAGSKYLGTRLAFAISPPSTGLDYGF